MLVPLSLPLFQHPGIRSGWHQVSSPSQRAVSLTPAMSRPPPLPPLTISRPPPQRSRADCIILFSLSQDPGRVDNANMKQNVSSSAICKGNLQRHVKLVFPSAGVLTLVFCHCDKCIIAPYFTYTKALFVLFKSLFLELLFNDFTKSFFSESDVSVIISVGYWLHFSFKLLSICI